MSEKNLKKHDAGGSGWSEDEKAALDKSAESVRNVMAVLA